jgi:hypothetical protein
MTSRRRITLAVAGLGAAAALGLGAILGGNVLSKDKAPSSASPPSTPTANNRQAPSLPAGMVEFRDDAAGFAVGYPADWQRLESNDPQVGLIATRNQKDSFLARVVRLNSPVGPADLPRLKTVTDEVVKANQGVEVLQGPREVQVGGVPGYFYLYRFTDAASGQRGAHSHYFLFRDATMITLVFQALPEESFTELAPLFDRIVSTFRPI